jgi:hypothetical protein
MHHPDANRVAQQKLEAVSHRLLPRDHDIVLDGFARYYFYVHKIMGYVLASFLIAGFLA